MEKLATLFFGLSVILFGLSCVKNVSYRFGYAKGKHDAFNMMGHIENLENTEEDEVDNPSSPENDLPDDEEASLPQGVKKA